VARGRGFEDVKYFVVGSGDEAIIACAAVEGVDARPAVERVVTAVSIKGVVVVQVSVRLNEVIPAAALDGLDVAGEVVGLPGLPVVGDAVLNDREVGGAP
jgi:hypothetical protein